MPLRLRASLNNERGIVLVITLFVVSLVTILVLDYNLETTVEVELADNYASQVRAYHLALAGLQFGRAVLNKDDASYDAADEPWHNLNLFGCVPPEQFLTLVQEAAEGAGGGLAQDREESGQSADAEPGSACVKLSIVDETRKLPLNALVDTATDAIREEWRTVFENFFAEFEIEADAVDALIDWVDLSPGHLAGGAEDDYYEGLETPYKTPDRALEVPGELRLVRHFDCETLAKLFPGKECKDMPDIDLGTNDYLTTFGGGTGEVRVNLNTANEAVLRAITQGDSTCVEAVMENRLSIEGQALATPIKAVGDLGCTIPNLEDFVGVTSTHFRIESEAEIEGLIKKKIVAILKREGNGAASPTSGNRPAPRSNPAGAATSSGSKFKMVYFKID